MTISEYSLKGHLTVLSKQMFDQTGRTGDITLEHLDAFSSYLKNDLPLEVVEKFEDVIKSVLRQKLRRKMNGREARSIALFQKNLGLLLKYKSYSIKCASPLGFSIFLQNPGEGFSFQQHLKHKTEIFHILDVQSGGRIFLCDYEDWVKIYEPQAFTLWLEGAANERFDQFSFVPCPGDVVVIDKLRIVHSVLGCILEEFATVSTDMVDRLHDQNLGKQIPEVFQRSFAEEKLRAISSPSTNRLIKGMGIERTITEIHPCQLEYGEVTIFTEDPIFAAQFRILPGKATGILSNESFASSCYIFEGEGEIILADEREAKKLSPPSISVKKGDVIMIPPGIRYGFVNTNGSFLKISQHAILPQTALI